MILLRRLKASPRADELERELRELVVAFRVQILPPDFPEADRLPAIVEGGQTFAGEGPLATFLEELKRTIDAWQRFQSDSCYLDDDGKPC